MERYKRIGFSLVIVCLVLFLSTPLSVNAEVKTGGVKISLVCFEEAAGRRTIFDRKPELVPNEHVSYIISVKNQGADAWVRLRVDYVVEGSEDQMEWNVGDEWLNAIGADWEKRGEYWYYTKPLKRGESIEFCKEVRVPDIDHLPNGMDFKIISRAEAIQASHIVPDFTSENPFSGFYIEGSSVNGEWEKKGTGFEVIYENGADTIVRADALFKDVEMLMPGIEEKQIVTVRNANPYDIRLLMKEIGGDIDELLWKKVNLTIKRNDKEIYDGPLANDAMENGLLLGEYEKNSEEGLEFILSLSEHAGNETAFKTIDLAVVFAVEPIIENKYYDEDSGNTTEKNDSAKIYPYPDPTVETGYSSGSWKLVDEENHIWEYYFSDGRKAKDGWLYLYNPYSQDEDKNNWFCFNEKGVMQYGWIKTENENWYFCHEISDGNLGKLKKGWHCDLDDRRDYYLDPVTGIMQTGWRKIDGMYYYFTPLEETYRQNWFWNTKVGRWIYDFFGYRTYGSMFKNERTPDGYLVGMDGTWIGE